MTTHMRRRPAWQYAVLVTITFTLLLFSIPTLIAPTTAQTTKATILGRVADEQGNAVSKAKVIAKNLDTGIPRESIADQDGRYRISELPLGKYEVQVQRQGFRLVVQRGIELTVGREAVLDFTLNVGDVQEQIVVEGDASLVDSTNSTVGYLVNRGQVEDLPLNGRDVFQLATLQPGVVSARQNTVTQESAGPATTRLIVNGSRLNSNIYYLDGSDTGDFFNNSPGGLGGGFLGVDALREFEVLTSNYSAEFGVGGGAIINAITKAGGNQFHGTAFEFLRNSSLDARNFFNAQKLPFKRNQFGGSLGGPILKESTFFFLNYEGLRRREGVSNIFFVPSPDARQGLLVDMSIPGANPNDPSQKRQITIDPSVIPYLNLYPRPNGVISGDTGIFRRDRTASTGEDFGVIRVDHKLNSNNSLFGRYTIDDSDLLDTAGVIADRMLTNRNQYFTLEGQSLLSPRAINTIRASYNRTNFITNFPSSVPVDPSLSFVPGQPLGQFSLQGLDGLRPPLLDPVSYTQNRIEISEQLIYNRSIHAFKFGAMVHRYQLNDNATFAQDGVFVYAGGVEAFLTASPLVLFVKAPNTDFYRGLRQTVFGFYAQDDLKLLPNLTLNLGLRYEPSTTPTEVNNKVANLRNVTDAAPTVGDPFIDNPSMRSFAPRVGFAYDPTKKGLWSIRGGFGIFNVPLRPDQYFLQLSTQPPFGNTVVLPGLFPNAFTALINSPIPFPNSLFAMQFDAEQTRVYQYSLSVQRELGKDIAVSAGYVGSRGVNLLTNPNINVRTDFQMINGQRFYPQVNGQLLNQNFGNLNLLQFNGDSNYNSLQLSGSKRFSAGLQFQASYTYAKSIDTASSFASTFLNGSPGGDPQDPFDFASERGLSDFDIRQNFVANFLYDLPFGKGRAYGADSGVVGKLIGGWAVGGILSLQTGIPFNPTLGFNQSGNGNNNVQSQRPNLAPGRSADSIITGNPNGYVDPTAFALQPAGFFGNLGRNTLEGPNLRTFDFSLLKKTPIKEGVNIEFRGEFFNLFNITNFAPPDAGNRTVFNMDSAGNLTTPSSFGQLTRTSVSSRQIQFGLKLVF
jgi:carboxypeptidase family protein/TonB-dependent receptor-like protein